MDKFSIVALFCFVAFGSAEQTDTDSRLAITTTFERFPFVVSLQYAQATSPAMGHVCGGGLVTLGHALTAAHCMFSYQDASTGTYVLHNANNFVVFTGAALLTNTGADRMRSVLRFIPHPDYIGIPSQVNDIGIIELSQPFPNTIGIVPIPLSNSRPADKAPCTVAGWAAPHLGQNVSNQLVYHDKYVYNQDLCSGVYASMPTHPNVLTTMICATSYNIAVQHCQGSSGNLLVCNGALTGVLSWYNCYGTSDPELYTRTSNYTNWIRQQTSAATTSAPGIAMLILTIVVNIVKLY